jgi:hypothetical protein
MGLIITLIVGGVIGWLASIVMRTDGQQGITPPAPPPCTCPRQLVPRSSVLRGT